MEAERAASAQTATTPAGAEGTANGELTVDAESAVNGQPEADEAAGGGQAAGDGEAAAGSEPQGASEPEADDGPAAPAPSAALRWVRRVGYAVLAVELIGLCAWSALLFSRDSLTFDYSVYQQGWYLIAHGNLDPYNSIQGHPYWQDHSELIMWPLALLYWLPPHSLMLTWLQDMGVVVAQTVAFTWLCEIAEKSRPGKRDAAVLAGVGLVLLVGNPFTWVAISWDFHSESIAVAFLALLAWDLANRRRRAWVWVVPLLACGDVAATYLVAIGVGAVLAGWRTRARWLTGLAMAAIGVVALQVMKQINGDLDSPFWNYGYLLYPVNAQFSYVALAKGMLYNPRVWVRHLWANRTLIWDNVASGGLLGFGSVFLLPLIVGLLLANNLAIAGSDITLFARPGFQSLPLYVLVPVGTVGVLGWLARRERLIAAGVAGLVLAQSMYLLVGNAAQPKHDWLVVSAPAGATLAGLAARIPPADEVVADQGVAGRFSGRTDIQVFWGPAPDPVPLSGAPVWFIIVPDQGIEVATPQNAADLMHELNGPGKMHATLVVDKDGVWAYRWQPPRGQRQVILP